VTGADGRGARNLRSNRSAARSTVAASTTAVLCSPGHDGRGGELDDDDDDNDDDDNDDDDSDV
jgi:hypothetical protein